TSGSPWAHGLGAVPEIQELSISVPPQLAALRRIYGRSGTSSEPPCENRIRTCLIHVHRDHLTRARQGVVQVVAELQRELVLSGRQLAVELGFALAEVHP